MDIKFKLSTQGCNVLKITSLELEQDSYLDKFNSTEPYFTYEDTITINVLSQVDSQENEKIVDISFAEHNIDIPEQTIVEFPSDGLFKVTHIVMPTKQWLDKYNRAQDKFSYTDVYFYNQGKFYKSGQIEEEVTIQEIMDLDYCVGEYVYTVSQGEQYTFNTNQLQECFYNYAKGYFSTLCSDGCNINETDIRNRDTIWMAINVIKYLLNTGKYFEAQKIIEKFNKCSGLCKPKIKGGNSCGCGC